MTITLDNRPEIPLHPLDLTSEPPQGNQAQFCVGMIQTTNALLNVQPSVEDADIVLGVPFMRNVYTVMAYTTPNSDGSFSPINGSSQTDGGASQIVQPHLGLMSLTNPTQALEEFHTERVLNQPISGGNGTSGGNGSTVALGGKRLSVGIVVLIAILSFFALCGLLFAIRWFVIRRKYRGQAGGGDEQGQAGNSFNLDLVAYMLTRNAPPKDGNMDIAGVGGGLTEDELRQMRYENYMRERVFSVSTMSSEGTQVVDHEALGYGYGYGYRYGYGKDDDEDFGVQKMQVILERSGQDEDDEMWGQISGTKTQGWSATEHRRQASGAPLIADQERQESTRPPSPGITTLPRLQNAVASGSSHRNSSSLVVPLLSQEAAGTYDSLTPRTSLQPQARRDLHTTCVIPFPEDLGQFGLMSFDGLGLTETMAGVGTASRTKKIDLESKFGRQSLLSTKSSNVQG